MRNAQWFHPVFALIFESIFYGMYIIFFGAAMYISWRNINGRGISFATTIIMFTLSTVRIVIDSWKSYHFSLTGNMVDAVDLPLAIMHTTNNLIANGLTVYRCCIIYRSKPVMVLSIVLFLASGVFGYAFPLSIASFSLALVTHGIVTIVSATRIWAFSRRIRRAIGTSVADRRLYRQVIFLILESGILYFLCLLALVLTSRVGSRQSKLTAPMRLPNMGPAFSTAYAITSQVVGIVPTITIIRVRLNILPSNQPPETTMHFATATAPFATKSNRTYCSIIPQHSVLQAPVKAATKTSYTKERPLAQANNSVVHVLPHSREAIFSFNSSPVPESTIQYEKHSDYL